MQKETKKENNNSACQMKKSSFFHYLILNGLCALVLQMHLRIAIIVFYSWLGLLPTIATLPSIPSMLVILHTDSWLFLLACFPPMTKSNKLLWLHNRLMRLRECNFCCSLALSHSLEPFTISLEIFPFFGPFFWHTYTYA